MAVSAWGWAAPGPAQTTGSHAVQSGEDLNYLLEAPGGLADTPRPLCLLLAGGGADEAAARSAIHSAGKPLADRGWVVAAPIAPDGRAFFGDNGRLALELIEELQFLPFVTDDPVLAVGISNGGIAAMEIAAEEPDRIAGVVAVPGVLSKNTDVRGLKDVPIFLRVGADDHLNWGQIFTGMERELRQAGARLNARLLEGVGHGVPIPWTEIDQWLAQGYPAELPRAAPRPREGETPARSLPGSSPAVRTWTSVDGKTMQAALVGVENGVVVLQSPSGRRARIRGAQLSPQDRQFVQAWLRRARP